MSYQKLTRDEFFALLNNALERDPDYLKKYFTARPEIARKVRQSLTRSNRGTR